MSFIRSFVHFWSLKARSSSSCSCLCSFTFYISCHYNDQPPMFLLLCLCENSFLYWAGMFSNRTSDPASFPLMKSITYYYVGDKAKYGRRYTMMLCHIPTLPRIPLTHTLLVECESCLPPLFVKITPNHYSYTCLLTRNIRSQADAITIVLNIVKKPLVRRDGF
jgi:hypothetical protein